MIDCGLKAVLTTPVAGKKHVIFQMFTKVKPEIRRIVMYFDWCCLTLVPSTLSGTRRL